MTRKLTQKAFNEALKELWTARLALFREMNGRDPVTASDWRLMSVGDHPDDCDCEHCNG